MSSQLSKVSRIGHIRQVSKTTIAVIRDVRARMVSSIAQRVPGTQNLRTTRLEVWFPQRRSGSQPIIDETSPLRLLASSHNFSGVFVLQVMDSPCQLSESMRLYDIFPVLKVSYCALGHSGLA